MGDNIELPLVYVIVLSHNSLKHLEYCLPSLTATTYPNHRILLVDNASSDESVAYTRTNFPNIEILQLPKNNGWSDGNNRGVLYAAARKACFVLLANADIRVHPDWVSVAVEVAKTDERIGFVGFNVFGTVRPGSLEDFQRAVEIWREIEVKPTQMIEGLALFINIKVFDYIGYFDEVYFAYADEEDFEKRAMLAGYQMVKTNIPIWHYSEGHFGNFPHRSSFFAMRNNLRLAIKQYNAIRILKTVKMLVSMACNPFYRADLTDVTVRRLRPGGLLYNASILSAAFLWNIWHLAATLKVRRRDLHRAIAARRVLLPDEPLESNS
jgi:GT2 family glycosyltransferase